jgi:hypothetical protein
MAWERVKSGGCVMQNAQQRRGKVIENDKTDKLKKNTKKLKKGVDKRGRR